MEDLHQDQFYDHMASPLRRSVSTTEFECACCYELMVNPTTLVCGHNFCRLCLARWYFSSKKRECPSCRQLWQGHPKVNITLRNMMVKLFGDRVTESEQNIQNNETDQKTLVEFEKQLSNASRQAGDSRAFCSGICITLGVIFVAYLAWYWRNSDVDLLIHKPVTRWKVDDVEQWLSEMEWAADYTVAARSQNVDGNMLLALDETNVAQVLNISNPIHMKTLLFAIQEVREKGVKMPSTLWEYKALYPGRSLFLLFGLKDFPRTTVLYLYFFNYEDVFLPFLHFTTPASDENILINWAQIPAPTTRQWLTFLTYMGLLPYWQIGKFMWSFLDVHFWTSWFVLATCLILTISEASTMRLYITGHWGPTFEQLKQHTKMVLSMSLFVLIWPVVPRLICDFFFYATLYFSPVQLIRSFYNDNMR